MARAVFGDRKSIAFVDDAATQPAVDLMSRKGAEFLGAVADWYPERLDTCLIAVGDPAARERLAELLRARSVMFEILVHPDATVAPSARVGPGSIVAPGARVSADVLIGEQVHVDQNV